MGQNDAAKKQGDHSSTTVLVLWSKHEGAPHKTADWARGRLCARTSSAASERAFLKAELIISKNRQRLMAVEVANLFLNPRNLGIPWNSVRFCQSVSVLLVHGR